MNNIKKPLLKLENLANGHDRSQVTTLIQNPYRPWQIITIGYDCFIRVWNSSDLSLVRSVRAFSPYLTSMVPYEGKFLMGIGNGNLLILNSQFQIQQQYQIHKDCISGISILSDKIVTASYDGQVHFLNKTTFKKIKSLYFGLPIYQILFYDNWIYIVSQPCYKIYEKTLQTIQIGKYNQFIVHNGKIFGCSDDKGIQCLNDQINIGVSCEYMISVGSAIVFSADQTVGVLFYNQNNDPTWHLTKIEDFKPGFSILSGFQKDSNIFMTGQSGEIYKLKVKLQNYMEPKNQTIQNSVK